MGLPAVERDVNDFSVPTLEDLESSVGDLEGKRILVRCDFNVPLRDGEIADDLRIKAAVPTLSWLQERGAHVVVCTHFGRPDGRPDKRFSVDVLRSRIDQLIPGVEIIENLRFDPGETDNSPEFVQYLVEGAGAQPSKGMSMTLSECPTVPTHQLSAPQAWCLQRQVDF